jgi:hypothetical protein
MSTCGVAMITDNAHKKIKQICKWCQTEFNVSYEQSLKFIITGGVCISCANKIANTIENRKYLDTIDNPILLMQPEPRQVYTANKKASKLFDKELFQMEGFRGGQVFDCIHAFTEAGCGKDINCEKCKIKAAIVDTFITDNSFNCVASPLEIKKNCKVNTYLLQISTEKIGEFALVRIDHYKQI